MSNTRSLYQPKVVAKMEGFVRNNIDDGTTDGLNIDAKLLGSINTTLTSGVGPSMANRGWQYVNKTLAAAATLTIDLYDYASLDAGAGNGNDQVGLALTVESIVAVLIKNENAVGTAGTLEIEPGAANPATFIGTHTAANLGGLRGGGFLFKYQPDSTGFNVTDASAHTIKLTANGADVVYSIWIWGRHDDETSSSSSSSTSLSSSSSSSSSSESSASTSSASSLSVSSSSSSSSSSATSSASSSKSSSSPSSSSSLTSSASSLTSSGSSSSSSLTSSASSASSESSSSEGA